MNIEMTQDFKDSINELEKHKKNGSKNMIDLYNDLGTIKWMSAVDGDAWDMCVDAIRNYIQKKYL